NGCCGSLNHHLGQTNPALRYAMALIDEVEKEGPFDAIVTTASGCGATIRDYGFMLQDERASAIVKRTRDIADLLRDVPLRASTARQPLRVAYHAACSL